MEEASRILILLGCIFLLGLVVNPLATRLNIPRVTLLIISGIALGPYGANYINGEEQHWFPLITNITLLIIGYLLGARLTREYLNRHAKGVLIASSLVTLTTSAIVCLGLWLLGFSLEIALVLGAIAAATDPAATLDVIAQRGRHNNFSSLLEGVVAMDDVLGLLVFSLVLALLAFLADSDSGLLQLLHMGWDIGGAAALGLALGGLTAYLLDKKPAEQPLLVESLGFILLCGGIAMKLQVSFLLAAMVMGLVVVNRANKTREHLHQIEFIEQPFLVLFFIMAGASLKLENPETIGLLCAAFIGLRILGRYLGGLAVPASVAPGSQRHWLGLALLPQAGIAMGMAMVATTRYPALAETVLPVAISATVFFEILGPIMTQRALNRSV